jgi:seryl-tRNA synthetase
MTDLETLKEEARQIRERLKQVRKELAEVTAEADAILKQIPNMTHPGAPIGPPSRD